MAVEGRKATLVKIPNPKDFTEYIFVLKCRISEATLL